MAWVKMGDDADMYPRLMEAAAHPKADARTVNELFGFIMRCAAYSAAHLTDSVIEMGVVYTYAGGKSGRPADRGRHGPHRVDRHAER